jgi:catechol 2,3-dioxygenase-like lactoylglutathione lyase family enzyme
MPIQLERQAIDLGVVTSNGDAMLKFYRDTLGLEEAADIPFPGLGMIKKLSCGDSFIKLLVLDQPADKPPCKEGFTAAEGFRYCAITVKNLDELVATCRQAGYKIVVDISDLRPGVRVAMVEDPDGNTLELMGQ